MKGVQSISRSRFQIPGMDCLAEERLVRLALEGEPGVVSLAFDLVLRRLQVQHPARPRRFWPVSSLWVLVLAWTRPER